MRATGGFAIQHAHLPDRELAGKKDAGDDE